MSEDMYTAAGLKLTCTPKNCEKRAARKGRNRVDDICNTILYCNIFMCNMMQKDLPLKMLQILRTRKDLSILVDLFPLQSKVATI